MCENAWDPSPPNLGTPGAGQHLPTRKENSPIRDTPHGFLSSFVNLQQTLGLSFPIQAAEMSPRPPLTLCLGDRKLQWVGILEGTSAPVLTVRAKKQEDLHGLPCLGLASRMCDSERVCSGT